MKVKSWNEISDAEIKAFYLAVNRLKEQMLPTDCDGDYPVNVIIVDRRQFWPLHYFPVPYNFDGKDDLRAERELLTNLSIAVQDLQRFRDIRRIREDK